MKFSRILMTVLLAFLSICVSAQKTSDEYWDASNIASKYYDEADYVNAAKAYEILWTKPNEQEIASHRLYAAAANCMIDNEEAVKENLFKIVDVATSTYVQRVLVNYEIFNKYKDREWWAELEKGMNDRMASLIAHHKNLKIFKKGRNYIFNGIRIDDQGDTIANKKITMIPRGTGWGDEAADSQSEVLFKYELTEQDSINHYAEVDSMVGNSFWNEVDTTGVIENQETVWIHPIRDNEFYKTEIAPFPTILFPVSDSIMKTIRPSTHIMSNWGWFSGTETKQRYSYHGTEHRLYNSIGEIECHHLRGEADNSRHGKSFLDYYFHEDYGFTEMRYITYDNDIIEFKLVRVDEIED